MNILLVSATFFEIRPFLSHLSLVRRQTDNLTSYTYKNSVVDVLIPGVGMVQTAYFLGRQLAQKPYGLAINAGIAGTFNTALPMGSVVNVVEDCVPELGAEDGSNFLSVFELGLTDPETHPYSGGKLVNRVNKYPLLIDNEAIRKLPEVTGITSNSVHGNIESIARIKQISSADIESMEGAAFLFACLSEHIPCLQIRSVSNRVEERDKSRWSLELALKNLNTVLNEIVRSLPGIS